MAQIRVAVEREIDAAPEHVYECVADYEHHHGEWLPPEYSAYRVESGNDPSTPIVFYHLKTGSRERDYRMLIGMPDPGRIITESDTNSTLVKTWTIDQEGPGSRVRIATEWQGSGGVGGFFERTFAPRVLSALYAVELQRLDRYARKQAS